MVRKKIEMPPDIYSGDQGGAIQKLTGGQTALPSTSSTQAAQSEQPPAKTGQTRNVKPTSIYLTPAQLRKLDDLAYTYNGRHQEKRIDRQDIIRHLVDTCDLGSLQGL